MRYYIIGKGSFVTGIHIFHIKWPSLMQEAFTEHTRFSTFSISIITIFNIFTPLIEMLMLLINYSTWWCQAASYSRKASILPVRISIAFQVNWMDFPSPSISSICISSLPPPQTSHILPFIAFHFPPSLKHDMLLSGILLMRVSPYFAFRHFSFASLRFPFTSRLTMIHYFHYDIFDIISARFSLFRYYWCTPLYFRWYHSPCKISRNIGIACASFSICQRPSAMSSAVPYMQQHRCWYGLIEKNGKAMYNSLLRKHRFSFDFRMMIEPMMKMMMFYNGSRNNTIHKAIKYVIRRGPCRDDRQKVKHLL